MHQLHVLLGRLKVTMVRFLERIYIRQDRIAANVLRTFLLHLVHFQHANGALETLRPLSLKGRRLDVVIFRVVGGYSVEALGDFLFEYFAK